MNPEEQEQSVYWECPNKHCGYRVTDTEYWLLKINPLCRCGNWYFGQFHRKVVKNDKTDYS